MGRFRFRWQQLCLLFCLSSMLLLPFIHGAADVYSEELLNLKSQITDHSNSLKDWVLPPPDGGSTNASSSEIQACSWSGVTCNVDGTKLTSLDLSKRSLSGTLTNIKFQLFTHLITLNLSYNSFSSSLPISIFNLTSLQTLDISRNTFSGHFPNNISSSFNTRLVTFDAFSNSFSGPLPTSLSRITTLEVLNLAGSYFSGPIPPEFGDFRSLKYIHLAGNDLSGSIPASLGKLQTLTHMEIGYNSYDDGSTIPPEIGNMSQLQYLDIAGADLTGSIPSTFGNLTKLHTLFLFKNQLTGPIPSEFGNLVSLRNLDLSDNQISGPIPVGFSNLKQLKLLSLFLNEMNGTVPAAITELPALESLLIWQNFFTGSLPEKLGRNSNLKFLDVSTNGLNGTIPNDLCANGRLSRLIIFSNGFSGELPVSLSQCSSLVRLRLENNLLTGRISLKFTSLPELSYIDLSTNDFVGGIPDGLITTELSSKLEYFNVSNNPRLGGSIPQGMWSLLPNLKNFSAAGCGIEDDIPTFKSCGKSITVIELNSNSLTGSIPESVSECQSLKTIDLSNNKLEGQIPKNLSSMPRGVFEGNENLCGFPLDVPCGSELSKRTTTESTEFLWVLILCITVVVFVALAVSGLFYYQRSRQNQWKMVSFSGLPQFTPNDILKSLNSSITEKGKDCSKALLPTGITVSVKKVEWEMMQDHHYHPEVVIGYVTQMGNARHKNLTRLLGYCYNKRICFLLYEYLPPGSNGNLSDRISVKRDNDWELKYKIVLGIAKGLCFLHHECRPAIPHGDLKTTNVVFVDNSSEPQLTDFGYKLLLQLNGEESFGSKLSWISTDHEPHATIKEMFKADIYSFGEMVVEIITNGRMVNCGQSIQSKPWEALLEDVYRDNQPNNNFAEKEEMKTLLEVALLCTRSRPLDRPTMEDVLKKLQSGIKR